MSTALSRQCRALRKWLPEYADGNLAGRRRAAVAEHLAGCARCAKEVAQLRTMLASLHTVEQEAAPAHLLAAIRASLREPAARRLPTVRRAPSLWTRLAVPIAAATGLVAIAFALRQPAAPRQAASLPAAAPAAPTGPARRVSAPVVSPSPTPEHTMPPRAASGGRRLGPALSREQVFGRGRAPFSAQAESAPPAEKPEPEKMGESAPGMRGAAGSATASAADAASLAPSPSSEVASTPAPRAEREAGGLSGGRGSGGAARPEARSWRALPPEAYPGRAERRAFAQRRQARRDARPSRKGSPGPSAPRPGRAARPPANAVVVQTDRGQAIALHLEPSMGRKVKVYAGNQMIRPAAGEPAGGLLLPADSLGPAPAQMPITVSSEVGDWKYTLFTPGLGQVGKQQSTAVKRYRLEPLSQVLSDLSAQSGLVLLVEGGTDTKVEGELPLASPKDAVALLADAAKLDAYTEDGVVYTLRPRR